MSRTSGSQAFPRSARLLTSSAFRQVFADAVRFSDQHLTLLARPNELQHGRIGLAISKRSVPRAVDRNRIKRAVRESFRLRIADLPPLDVVIMAKPVARDLESAALERVLDRLWTKMTRRCAGSS